MADLSQAIVLFVVLLALLAMYYGSSFFSARVDAVLVEVQQWVAGEAAAQNTSNGRRLSFWLHSIEAFVQAPWFGYGMGGYEAAVTPHAQAAGFLRSAPPLENLFWSPPALPSA